MNTLSEALEESGRRKGVKEGIKEGISLGEDKAFALMIKMNEAGRSDQIARLPADRDFLEKMYQKFGIE